MWSANYHMSVGWSWKHLHIVSISNICAQFHFSSFYFILSCFLEILRFWWPLASFYSVKFTIARKKIGHYVSFVPTWTSNKKVTQIYNSDHTIIQCTQWKSKTCVTSSNPRVIGSNSRVTSLNPRVTSSNSRVTSLNPRVTSSNPRVKSSNSRVRRLKVRVARLKTPVMGLKARVARLKARVRRLKARVQAIKPRVK